MVQQGGTMPHNKLGGEVGGEKEAILRLAPINQEKSLPTDLPK